MTYKISKYRGHDIIALSGPEGDKYPFSFGKNKARLIIENYEAIKKFASDGEEGGSDE